MTAALEVTLLHDTDEDTGFVAGFAITDEMIVAAGGTSSRAACILASSNARHFESRKAPRELGLRDVLAVGDALWVCGEHGQLAVSRDHGETWKLLETGTDACLFGLAHGADDAVWVCGDAGFAGRVLDERVERIELGTRARIAAMFAVGDEIAMVAGDGRVYKWQRGQVTSAATGAARQLTGIAITRSGTWVVTGDGGFVARSPDGLWFSRATSGVHTDLEAIAALADGRLVVVGEGGQIVVSSDDGRTWTAIATSLTAHLWSVAQFGGGVLIGGDGGLVVKLAPARDATWQDRVNVFAGTSALDAIFVAGPDEFIARGLATYLEWFERHGKPEAEGEEVDAEFESIPDELDEARSESHELFERSGDAASFERNHGVALQPDVAQLRELAAGHCEPFEQLHIDARLMPDAGEHNLFEMIVRRAQRGTRSTQLTEAFCGTFGLGRQDDGDAYHVELYSWDGPRQILHHDHDTGAYTGVVADSMDSLTFLGALMKARRLGGLSDEGVAIGLRKLRGRVAPMPAFGLDRELGAFDPKRHDTEFLFYRSRWICALLRDREDSAIAELFQADLNQVVPQDQLPARFEACEKYIPTALYSMWRAYLFDEPELASYLEIGRRHKARLVRDAAALIDELRDGRNELGTIADVQDHVAGFRALDLDPRRAEQRALELEARARQVAARKDDAIAELERTPQSGWTELAWRWLGDGSAHRALLERLDRVPELAAQIAALDELRGLSESDREIALPRLADALAPELEAVLVGSLVRDDALEGVLATSDDEDGDDGSPGWDAIDQALVPIYGDAEPHAHYCTVVPYELGGGDPIHGISVYLRTDPSPHFHLVTYGFTDLFVKETDDPEISGVGFELTFRVARASDDEDVPIWAVNFLQNLGRYVFSSGNRFGIGHKMGLNGPIALDHDTAITAIAFAEDPELGEFVSPFGSARFLQVVGITDDEYRLIQEWSVPALIEVLAGSQAHLITDLGRRSLLADPALARAIHARVEVEGSAGELATGGDLMFELDGESVRIELGALYAAAIPQAMRGRLRHGRQYALDGTNAVLRFRPGEAARYEIGDRDLTLVLPEQVIAEIEARLRPGLAGSYRFETWPVLQISITPSIIRDREGRAIDVRGVADPDEVRRLVDAANAPTSDEDAEDPPAGSRVTQALELTRRALALAPEDPDVQFTHAMLLLDGERTAELFVVLPQWTSSVRIQIAVRMGKQAHAQFADAIDAALDEALPSRIVAESQAACGSGAMIASLGNVAQELFSAFGELILARVPDRMARLIPLLPDDIGVLTTLGVKAIQADHREHAVAIYDRLLDLPIPDNGHDRANYLRGINNACVSNHAVRAYDKAAQIADRAQPVAHENPHIYHSAACAYAAIGDYAKAFEQVKLAVQYDYAHLGKVEVDGDLGPILEWPEFKALFRDWHARQEGN